MEADNRTDGDADGGADMSTEPYSIADLATFALVARHEGFRQTARASDQSASALSEAVRRLEGRLGIRLPAPLHAFVDFIRARESGGSGGV